MNSPLIAMDQIRSGKIQPQPLYRDIEPASPYPVDALCKFSGAAQAIQRVIKAPDAICGQSILAGLALVAQAHADISIDGRRRPLSCFFATVGETGERKSAVDDVAKWPHSKYERALGDAFTGDYQDWGREHIAWKQERDIGLKKLKTKHQITGFLKDGNKM